MSYSNAINGGFGGTVPVIIANGQQTSAVLPTSGLVLCGVFIPAAFTGTTLTFLACDTAGGTFVPVQTGTGGTALSYTVAAGTYAAIDPKDFSGIPFLQIKSGSAEGAARTLICAMKGF